MPVTCTEWTLGALGYGRHYAGKKMKEAGLNTWKDLNHCVMDQYVHEVTDFSSQYGSDGSISYVANNVISRPNLYPDYGDFSAAYCLRSYGKWWKRCESATPSIKDPIPVPLFPPSVDFIDMKFEYPVYPIRVDFYETYNPGAIVRVWGSLEGKRWYLLWGGEPQTELRPTSRIFSPPIDQIKKLVNMLRIEFDQDTHNYYSALDAVLMVGSAHSSLRPAAPLPFKTETLCDTVKKLGLHSTTSEDDIVAGAHYLLCEENLQQLIIVEDIDSGFKEYLEYEYEKRKELVREEKAEINNHEKSVVKKQIYGEVKEGTSGGYFDLLPEELILHIVRQLDLRSMCRLSLSCRLLHKYTADPVLYMNLNLKNWWWLVSNGAMMWLSTRCSLLQTLDLSWCGPYGALDTETFLEFIHTCGHKLTSLRVNNCHFIDNYCLYMIANVCLNLEELSMAHCSKVDHLGFGELKKARGLSRLDLSRTGIDFHTLQLLLQHAPNLRHLSLNNCLKLEMDEVAKTLATFNLRLLSLQAWKTRGLTQRGLRALASITTLTDLDLGWALSGVITEGLSELTQSCQNLQRLYLSALRTITDHDINVLTKHAQSLRQLDIMGTRNITSDAVHRLLMSCQLLELLDVSFCEQISLDSISQWREMFPSVSIKGGQKAQVRIV